MPQDQQHPQEKRDREVINGLLAEDLNDYNLAELARLRIRYRNFPGARQIHQDLDFILQQWQLTEEKLFATTRQLHESGKVYRRQEGDDIQDWS